MMSMDEYIRSVGGLSPMQRKHVKEAWVLGKAEGAKEGVQVGVRDANTMGFALMLNAAALALHREFGFGTARCQRFVDEFDKLILNYVCIQDIVDDVAKECGFRIPLDRDGLGMD